MAMLSAVAKGWVMPLLCESELREWLQKRRICVSKCYLGLGFMIMVIKILIDNVRLDITQNDNVKDEDYI